MEATPSRRSKTVTECDTQPRGKGCLLAIGVDELTRPCINLGPTTVSVARMKTLINKVNTERTGSHEGASQNIQPNLVVARGHERKHRNGTRENMGTTVNGPYPESATDSDHELRSSEADEDVISPRSDNDSLSGSGIDLSSRKKGSAIDITSIEPLEGRSRSQSGSPAGSLISGEQTEKPKRGSRLFGLRSKPEKKREKKEDREREERDKEQTIALLFDRLRLWREKEKIPENVQLMNMKQIKAEKRWLKKELHGLDSKVGSTSFILRVVLDPDRLIGAGSARRAQDPSPPVSGTYVLS